MTGLWALHCLKAVTLITATTYVAPIDRTFFLDDISPQTAKKKKVNSSAIYFQSMPYSIMPGTGLIDYDGLAAQAKLFRPRLIICGAPAYPRDWDFGRLKQIADNMGAYLMADITHTGGLVAAQELNSPFDYCDVVTTAT